MDRRKQLLIVCFPENRSPEVRPVFLLVTDKLQSLTSVFNFSL